MKLSAGKDYTHALGRYEYVLFNDDGTIAARQTGFKSKRQAVTAGRRKADELLKGTET